MAFRTNDSPPSGSQSPSASSSASVSPVMSEIPIGSIGPSSEENDSSTQTTRGTATTRSQNASKGGCWTCRVRRKKCDEQREDDSCKTCKRLTIKCLGWGPRRPDWMRDKQAVDEYKANIKAKLTQKGLIRGQPRSNAMNPSSAPQRPVPYRRQSSRANGNTSQQASLPIAQQTPEFSYHSFDHSFGHDSSHGLMPALPGASNSTFERLSLSPYSGDNLGPTDPTAGGFRYSQPTPSSSYLLPSEQTNDNFLFFASTQEALSFDYTVSPSLVNDRYAVPPVQNAFHEELVMQYFNHVHKLQFIFAGDKFTDATYQAIVAEPRGAVTLAICALVNLYSTRMRVAQGLEPPSLTQEGSQTMYLRQEAIGLLQTNKDLRGGWRESDAIAALHLISFSQLSGGASDWETPFAILCEWLSQTGIRAGENARIVFSNMTLTSQLLVKVVLWLDTFATISLMKPPRFLSLWRHLLLSGSSFWRDGQEITCNLRMDSLTGCPNEAMLGIAEVSALAHWKAAEQRKGSLSYRELIRQGDAIEQRLRQRSNSPDIRNQEPLHVNVPPTTETGEVIPSDIVRSIVANIFKETAILYLHSVLNNSSPGVPEINGSVESIVHLLSQLRPSDVDRALVFPICLAGCMTNDLSRRDFLKSRLQLLDESIGNLLQTRLLMEAVWQKRELSGGAPVDVREVIRERGLNIILI